MDRMRTQTDRSVSFCLIEPVWQRALRNSAKKVNSKGVAEQQAQENPQICAPTEALLGQLFGVAIIERAGTLIVEFAGLLELRRVL